LKPRKWVKTSQNPPKIQEQKGSQEPKVCSESKAPQESIRLLTIEEPPKVVRQPYHDNPELDKEIENLPDGKVNCPRCPAVIAKCYYREHTERVHLNIKNFICDRCGKEFYLFPTLEQHMNIHLKPFIILKPFECELKCGEFFARKSAMKAHVEEVHLERSLLICEICAMKFNSRYKLKVRKSDLKIRIIILIKIYFIGSYSRQARRSSMEMSLS
jgi:hypothetical protein